MKKFPYHYEVYDPIAIYYKSHPNAAYEDLSKEPGFQWNDEFGVNQWMTDKIHSLGKMYKHCEWDSINGGDDDILVIDRKSREWCFWENGFWPFCLGDEEVKKMDLGKNLKFWLRNRQ